MQKVLGLAALLSLALTSAPVFAQETKGDNQALKIDMEVTHEGKPVFSPVLIGKPGEWFAVEIANKRRSDAAGNEMIGFNAKCRPEPQPVESLSLDCSFKTVEAEGDNTKTRTMQMKFVMAMGGTSTFMIGDQNQAPKIFINVRAAWVPMPEKVAVSPAQ